MALEILNTPVEIVYNSVVVVAQSHNPTILHPSFLETKKIVPSEWNLASGAGSVICTNQLSVVKYENGLVFTVEDKRFQIKDDNPTEDFTISKVPEIAKNYIKVLPEVPYKSVGININIFIEHSSPENFLLNHFLSPKIYKDKDFHPQTAGLNLLYLLDETKLRLSLDAGKVKRKEDDFERRALIVNANYHTDISGINKAVESIELFASRCSHFIEKTKSIIESGEPA